jgi:hypothetical protein
LKVLLAGAIGLVAIAGCGYLFKDSLLPRKDPQPVAVQATQAEFPAGAILIPIGDGICRMNALDNATGKILDYGVVQCSNASEKNSKAWMEATRKDKYIEIGKSFRHEGDRE